MSNRPWMLILLCAMSLSAAPSQTPSQTHWAFGSLADDIAVPPQKPEDRSVIDAFVRARLGEEGLEFSAPADRVSLIRRLFLSMHGLPPTPEQVMTFVQSNEPNAYEQLVEEVLGSPRLGERWAQHWLDIVRYADTHGYEVNTPRPNAWPYRDYVIQAFNQDKPYDRFVVEQLAGDALGADAATGFLVASAVLLPGQIGADDASKRLARQDALDEMIVATGETFLGLSVGCARCHDHKFDPIPQREYYTMQAFFAGVEYGDRPINDAGARTREHAAAQCRQRIAARHAELTAFEPSTSRTLVVDDEDAERASLLKAKAGHGENPAGNQRGFRDDPGDRARLPNLSGGRYTWWENAPGQDMLAYSPALDGRFRVWLSWGVHGGGTHTRDARYLLDRDGDPMTHSDQEEIAVVDQTCFAGTTASSTGRDPLWSGLFDAGTHSFRPATTIILRGGNTGAAITSDVAVFEESDASSKPLPRLRTKVNATRNVERFAPSTARWVRFTILATENDNQYEPCVDELEVYEAGSDVNLALAERGTTASSSGNFDDPDQHKLEHINDGRYGNGRSWISDTRGAGWVQLALPAPATIDRIVWSRDRDGKFRDRLATRYRVEIASEQGQWRVVAGSGDRLPHGAPGNDADALARNVSANDAPTVIRLLEELQAAEGQLKELADAQMVFAGTFRKPDMTTVLHRGDPEQPGDAVGPKVLSLLGTLSLPQDAPEQSRRIALAHWIASKPLAARVMVNRIWQYHFGQGLVDTPSDFGLNGSPPSHPQLLNWLAREFIRGGWSVKNIHRMILRSATYRQSSQIHARGQATDADSRLLWRFPSRRLEAESIRDSMLWVNGRLNLTMGGPGFDFFKSRGGLDGFPPLERFGPAQWRRMIYAHKVRMERVPVFGAFDCPDAGQPMPRRRQSMTAIQALNLFNSPFVADQAEALAVRLQREAGTDPAAQVRRAFLLAFGREPGEREAAACEAVIRQHGASTLGRVLFNSNEFLYLP